MDQVPKILKPLVNEWTPEGYIVSFKVGTLVALCVAVFYKYHILPLPHLDFTSLCSKNGTTCLIYLARDRIRTSHPESQSHVGTLWPPSRHWK